MLLNIIIDEHSMDLNVPDSLMEEQSEAYERLDQQMAEGLQIGREWVAEPSTEQRCQVAAQKLLAAIEGHNEGLALLAAGYIITRRPRTMQVTIDTTGEPGQTRFA